MDGIVWSAIAHVVDLAQERVESFGRSAKLPAARAYITVGADKEFYIECDTPFANGNIGAHAEAVELFLTYGDAAHATTKSRASTFFLGE